MTEREQARVEALLERYGQTFADEIGIRVERNTPAPLFQLACAAMLYSARIASSSATRAMKALLAAGLTTPHKMARASWRARVDVLTNNGYKRFDERTSSMLGEAAELVLERWNGDLRRLRAEAGRIPERERELVQALPGIGPVGADIFLREVQGVWPELYPYADARVLDAARHLGLARDIRQLRRLVGRRRFPVLVAALVRAELAHDYDLVA